MTIITVFYRVLTLDDIQRNFLYVWCTVLCMIESVLYSTVPYVQWTWPPETNQRLRVFSCLCSKLTTDMDCSKLTTTDCSKQTTVKEKHHSTALNCYSLQFSRQNCCGRVFRSRMWVILSLSHLQLLKRNQWKNVVLARHAILAYTPVADIPIN
jgi:hypothetical protein